MKLSLKLLVLITGLFTSMLVYAAAGVDGMWTTIDDVSGKPKSVVKIWQQNGTLYGQVMKIIPQKGVPVTENCDACKGAQKGKPIVGMTIMWGLKPDNNGGWGGGTILDPKIGKTYRCMVTPSADGKTLKVRGYIGFSLLGRTQTWQRAAK